MKLNITAFCDIFGFLVTLFSFTGTDPGTRGVCADVAV